MKTAVNIITNASIFDEINSFSKLYRKVASSSDSSTLDIRTNRRSRTQCDSIASRQLEWKRWADETLGLTQARIENLFLTVY